MRPRNIFIYLYIIYKDKGYQGRQRRTLMVQCMKNDVDQGKCGIFVSFTIKKKITFNNQIKVNNKN